MNENTVSDFKCGYVALVGLPNVGKSTLMNNLLQMKLSIVTPKPQTTRQRVLGILNEPDKQVIFLDTPGLLKPRYKLQEVMLKTIEKAVSDSDLILLMIEAGESLNPRDIELYDQINEAGRPVVLVINKIDRISKAKLLPLIETLHEQTGIQDIVPISATKLDGLDQLKSTIKKYMPMNVPFYPPEYVTEQPERFFVAEIIREKIFQKYGEEIPYSSTVIIDEFKERKTGKDFIRATIYVERISQKGILIGKKGQALKKVGLAARGEIEHFLQRQVYLDLHVSVKEKWRSKENALRDLGYH
ncbi:GTPase Era [candidate division KSB1 bacterium]|nr:GTPase Era [candidate division KSB1 bacterium]